MRKGLRERYRKHMRLSNIQKKNPETVRKFSEEARKPYSFSGRQSVYQIKGEMIDKIPI
jgi:hypothetical protein